MTNTTTLPELSNNAVRHYILAELRNSRGEPIEVGEIRIFARGEELGVEPERMSALIDNMLDEGLLESTVISGNYYGRPGRYFAGLRLAGVAAVNAHRTGDNSPVV